MVGDILQPTHLLFVLVVALLVLGPKRLPEVAKTLGNGLRDFRSALSGDSDHDDESPRTILPPDEPAQATVATAAPTAVVPAPTAVVHEPTAVVHQPASVVHEPEPVPVVPEPQPASIVHEPALAPEPQAAPPPAAEPARKPEPAAPAAASEHSG